MHQAVEQRPAVVAESGAAVGVDLELVFGAGVLGGGGGGLTKNGPKFGQNRPKMEPRKGGKGSGKEAQNDPKMSPKMTRIEPKHEAPN